MLAGKFGHLIRDVTLAQQVGELVVADIVSSSVPQAIKIKVVCCGSAFSASRNTSFSLRVLLSAGPKMSVNPKLLNALSYCGSRGAVTAPLRLPAKKEQPGIFQR